MLIEIHQFTPAYTQQANNSASLSCTTCSIFICTTTEDAWWTFFICYNFQFCKLLLNVFGFFCKFAHLSEMCCCQDQYISEVWFFCCCLCEISSAFCFSKHLVMTRCVIDALFKMISRGRALFSKSRFPKLRLWLSSVSQETLEWPPLSTCSVTENHDPPTHLQAVVFCWELPCDKCNCSLWIWNMSALTIYWIFWQP